MSDTPANEQQPQTPIQDTENNPASLHPPLKKKRITKPYDKKVHGKRYPIIQRVAAKAMMNNGMTPTEAAKGLGAGRKTIYRIWNDPELQELDTKAVSSTKKGLASLFYKRSLQSLMAMDQSKFDNAPLNVLAITSGIMTEKGRLMEGLSTENVSHRGVIENLDAERAKIMSRIQSLDISDDNKP